MAKLVIRTGAQMGAEFSADQPAIRLGRGSGSDIVLQDSQVSRRHAEIVQQGDQVVIRDLGSTNGTFVNDERVVEVKLLATGDRIRLGSTVLSYEPGVALAGAGPAAPDWQSDLWQEEVAGAASRRRSRVLVWGLAGLAVVLLAGLAVALVLTHNKPEAAAPAASEPAATPAPAIAVAPTATSTQESATAIQVQPTDTALVELPTVELEETVAVQAPVPTVKPPTAKPPAAPSPAPLGPAALEQLPAIVAEAFPGVPPDQLPQAIAQQMESMSPEELQAMIGALFPGVDPAHLPQVVAASFPEIGQAEIQGLLQAAFPGQSFEIPAAGPVGGRIALGIYDQGRDAMDLYLVNTFGGQRTLVVEQATEPDFSPDGQWLVCFSWASDRLGLRLRTLDGSQDQPLTTVDQDGYPSFSPDGQQVVFYNHTHSSVEVINRDGSNRREIAKGDFPAWSPAGNQIVFRGCLGGGRCGLIVANSDGSNQRQITTHANDSAPRWSPNGGQIVFHSDRDGNWEIYVINSDGSWLRRITNHQASDYMPVWSPDGLRVAFRSDRGGHEAVWATSGIGGPATKLFDAGYKAGWAWDWGQMDWGR